MVRDIGVGVAVLVKNSEGDVLLLKRKNKLGNGCWGPPGGHLEKNESIIACARRECIEEIAVEINEFSFLGVTNNIHKAQNKHYISIWMSAEIDKSSHIVPEEREVGEYRWFKMDKLPSDLFLPFEEYVKGHYLKTGNLFSI